MNIADKKKPAEDGKSRRSGLVGLVLKFFHESLFPSELGNINRCLVKANEISPSPYFMKLLNKNRVIWFFASLPSIVNFILLFMYFQGQNTVTREIMSATRIIQMALATKKPDMLLGIHFSENFIYYLGMIMIQILVLTSLSWIFMAVIRRVNPIIKNSKELREYCLSKNYSTEQDQFFLVCKAGVLARVSSSSGDDLVKDKFLWRHLNKIPKDPIESPKDRNIVFIGNGFQLQKYEFKIT